MLPWLLCALLTAALLTLWARLRTLQRSLDEMADGLAARLGEDTNNPLFLSTRDAHARRLAERLNGQLRILRQQRLQYENGNKELEQAVTDVSHDLRTPLTAVRGYLELLEREPLTKNAARYLAQIDGRVRAMIELTEEMLRYASSGGERALEKEPVDLNAAVEESVAGLYASFTARGIAPTVTLPEARVVRRLDKAALARVLENLLSNALKYSGGDVAVTLTADGRITCANSAPGLDEVQVGRLFDRFFTVQTANASTGLGLSIAKSLTERMGGTIGAQYEAGMLSVTICFAAREEKD